MRFRLASESTTPDDLEWLLCNPLQNVFGAHYKNLNEDFLNKVFAQALERK